MNIHTYTVEQLRPRIIRAIKNGNNERKYIEEACKAEYSWPHFGEAMRQLEQEGIIKYNENLEGYYLTNPITTKIMFEKVNPSHPDKVADRIAGAVVDLCYRKSNNPKVACEVLIGHGECNIQVETSEQITQTDCEAIVERIAGEGIETRALIVPQDIHLAANQHQGVRCGDNGIFKGVPMTHEQKLLTEIAASIYEQHPYDGKYIIQGKGRLAAPEFDLTVCQSHVSREQEPGLRKQLQNAYGIHQSIINPLGEWTGGPNTDSGATNRKLGSDMGDGVTGGGLHGKDLSKADVSVNIVCHLLAQKSGETVTAMCSIGDDSITFNYENGKNLTLTYPNVVHQAREYITSIGGFEKFAEWGLIR